MTHGLLELELQLQTRAETEKDRFPIREANYWDRYAALLNYLKTQIYPHINAGLACKSKSPGLYTEHGENHFDEVVRYAGFLLGKELLEPYDLFLMLAAIRLHDAGNIDGRELHETRVGEILKASGNGVCTDPVEIDLIAKIAEAHGGKVQGTDNKDTISELPDELFYGPIWCHPRSVAALVRFADEICEHSNRASFHHISNNTLPPHNTLFHYYASSIKGAACDRVNKIFNLRLVFEAAYLKERYPTPKHTEEKPDMRYLIDDAKDRIDKLNTERIYCNRFLKPALRTEIVEVSIEVVNTVSMGNEELELTEKSWSFRMHECGYPDADVSWREAVPTLQGETIASQLGEGG